MMIVDADLHMDIRMARQEFGQGGPQDVVTRIVPPGSSRWFVSASSDAAMSASAGSRVASSCSPACVGATLRVVRTSSLTPSSASRRLTVWLNADCDTPSLAAARVKLRSTATARNTAKSFNWSIRIE
jgi:hypothetical protein